MVIVEKINIGRRPRLILRQLSPDYKTTSFPNASLDKKTPVGLQDRGFQGRGRLRKTTLKGIFEGSLRCIYAR